MSEPSPTQPPTEPLRPGQPTEPLPVMLAERPAPVSPRRPPRRRRRAAVVATTAGAALVLGIAAAVGYWSGDDGTDVATEPTTTVAPGTSAATTEAPTTEAPTTTTPTTSTVVTPPPVDTTTAVFPYASGSVRYHDPLAAARGFAVDFAGFTQPVLGAFQQGDTRSGEVEIRPTADGPVTVVFVRQLGADDSWWVLGAVTEGLNPVRPEMDDAITSPVTVTGTAVGYEGQVKVQVLQDGSTTPLGSGYVTGSGSPPAGPFRGQVTFDPPTEDRGAMVFTTGSGRDGGTWTVAAYRIRFDR
jgi:hypothetical protein